MNEHSEKLLLKLKAATMEAPLTVEEITELIQAGADG
jgi:hypothetical protein